jgi:hypothetical protein
MNPVKRTGVAAVLVAGVMLLASTAAAQAKDTYELVNVCESGDQDADATGQVTHGEWRRVKLPPEIPPPQPVWWECSVTINCQNLTPGATYETGLGTFTANRKGNGKVSGYVWSVDYPGLVPPYVYRLNANASRTLVFGW